MNKMARKKIIEDIDPLTEAYLVSGSNPSTKDLLSDLQVDTELSVMMRGQIPARTVELRRRSLKSEHCLQITLECRIQDSREGHYQSVHQSFGAQGGLDAAGGYDDFSTPAQELDVKVDNETDLTTEDEWHNSPYKIFIDNIAPDVADSDLIHALRHGGAAKSVRFMKSSQGSILSAPLSRDSVPLTADALYEKFGIRTDARPRICGNGELRNVLLPKNPLAVITAVKRRAIKKTIAQVFVSPYLGDRSVVTCLRDDQLRYLRGMPSVTTTSYFPKHVLKRSGATERQLRLCSHEQRREFSQND